MRSKRDRPAEQQEHEPSSMFICRFGIQRFVRHDGQPHSSVLAEDSKPIQLSNPVEFQNIIQMCDVLNGILSKAEGFVAVPTPRQECKINSYLSME